MERKIPFTNKKIIIAPSNPGPGRPSRESYVKKSGTARTGQPGGKDKRRKV